MLLAVAAAAMLTARSPHLIRQIPLPLGVYPSSIATGADGALWFSTYPYFTNHPPRHLGVGRMDVAGHVTYFAINHGTYDLTPGPDGRIWFTSPYRKPYLVGAIAMDGTITTWPVPGGGLPESIIAGPDGDMWFTAFGGSPDIFRMTTAGAIVGTYSSSGHDATRLGAGRNGFVWYDLPSRIGRISTAGKVLERQIGGPGYVPEELALGSDDRMWECDGTYVVAISGDLTPTFYRIPSQLNGTYAVARGPGPDLWVTDFAQGALIRVATDGSMTGYPLPDPNASLGGITKGPDGKMWFTEIDPQTDASAIGVFAP